MQRLATSALGVTVLLLLITVVPAGAIWQEQAVPFVPGLRCVDAVDELVVWAAGVDGTVLVTVDGGLTWTYRSVPSTTLTAIHGLDDQTCVAGSDSGQIMRTTDGGLSWLAVGSFGAAIHDIHFFNSGSGRAVGDPVGGTFLVLTTADGGVTWVQSPTAPPAAPGMHGFMGSCTWDTGVLGMFGTNQDVIWRTDNAGMSWESVPTNNELVRGLVLGGTAIGFAGGDAGRLDRSTDAGATWVAATCPSATAMLHSFAWIEGTEQVWALARSESPFFIGSYQSMDAGVDWTWHELPVDFTAFDLDFANNQYGWTVGEFSAGFLARVRKWIAAEPAIFTDVTPWNLQDMGGMGVAWDDYDNDGDFDLFLARDADDKLFRCDGELEFVDVTEPPLADDVQSWPSAWADYDNDGDLDLFVLKQDLWLNPLQNLLARNDGNNVFVDVTGIAGKDSLAAPTIGGFLWSDLDDDGDLDLYLTDIEPTVPSRMFRNDGNDAFALVPAGAASDIGPSIYPAAADFDNDGDRDIYVPRTGAPNQLLRNDGGFDFVDVASDLGVADPGEGWTADWGDYDNDSDLDLFLASASYPGHRLFRNDGWAGFTDVTVGAGIATEALYSGGIWFDFDNDCHLDLLVGNYNGYNRLYWNDGTGHFTDVAGPPYQNDLQTTSGALTDFDHDGDVDVFLSVNNGESVMLLRNDLAPGNHWLHVRLVGNPGLGPPFSNVSAIGARVRLEAGGLTQIREIASPGGANGHCSLRVEFGLGLATSIDLLEVRWPSGRVDSCESPPFLDEQLSWVEGEPCPTTAVAASAQPALSLMLHQNYPNPFNPSTAIRYDLTEPGAVRIRVYDVEGRFVRLLEESAHAPAGSHTIRWDGRSDRGRAVASGIYYYRIEAGDWTETRPMVLVR